MIKTKVIMIDIDGTICTEERAFERPLAKPLVGSVEAVIIFKKNGHTVIFNTARGWEQYKITKKWLDDNGFLYDQIIMGKPIVDIFIDDRACEFTGWNVDYLLGR